MTHGELQRHGDTYYWYKPNLGDYIKRRAQWKEMYLWAVDNFGEPGYYSTIPKSRRWYAAEEQFNFLKEEDRMYMIMRWA